MLGARTLQALVDRLEGVFESLEGGGDAWHGSDGPLQVTKSADPNPIYQATIEAGRIVPS